MKRSALVLFAAALTALHAGCSATTTDDDELAGDGIEVITSSSQAMHLGSMVFEPVTQSDPEVAASEVVGPPSSLWPSGCVTRTKDANDPRVAHVVLDDCTGPYGLLHLTGEVLVTFSLGAGGALHAEIAGVDLAANGKPIDFAASADITSTTTTRHVVWSGHWNRTNDKGLALDHTSDLTVDIDTAAGCRAVDGSASTTVTPSGGEARGVESTFADVKVCKNPDGNDACPSGTVTHTGKVSEATVTCAYDGSATAAITGAGGRTWEIDLVCPALEPG